VLADRYQGHRLNIPNDVTCDEQGRLFLTDPRDGPNRRLEMADEAVCRLYPDGTLTRVVSQPDAERPNGLAITLDCTELYVVDSNHLVSDNRKIWAFTLDRDGSDVVRRMVYDFCQGPGGDALGLDSTGNLYVCAGIMRPRTAGEISDVPQHAYIITPGGQLIDVIHIPQDVITAASGPRTCGPCLSLRGTHTLLDPRRDACLSRGYAAVCCRYLKGSRESSHSRHRLRLA
jgi:gluconolactonase